MATEPYAIVIPARYASSRFPAKMLAPMFDGRALVIHTWERACESAASEVIVATDDERIATVCRDAGADCVLTSAEHPSGTDRIAEVAERKAWPAERIVVGLQGDEPTTPAAWLDRLAANLADHADADIATLAMRLASEADYHDPNRVKLVLDHRGMAMYFSRAPIPWRRDPASDTTFPDALLHVGLYAYRRSFLHDYPTLPDALIEREEKLEQLRALYAGKTIHVGIVQGHTHGVDHPDDLATANRELQRLHARGDAE